jgi:hypothetical protein
MVTDAPSNQIAPPRAPEHRAAVQRLLLQGRPGFAVRMPRRELLAEAIVASAFLAAAAALAISAPASGSRSPAVIGLFVLLYGAMSMIEFDVGSGYGQATQLVLIPMLYAVPPGAVPLLVAGGYIMGRLPAYIRGTARCRWWPTRGTPSDRRLCSRSPG